MRRLAISLLLLAVFVSFSGLVTAAEKPKKSEKEVALFNGKNLDGWGYFLVDPKVKMKEVWSVKDGILICKGEPMGYLCTNKEYKNFKLTVEWRWPEGKKPGNSGVLMRITGKPRALPKCVEAQLQSGSAGNFWAFHGFSIEADPARTTKREHEKHGKMINIKRTVGNEKEPGQWNRYDITVKDGIVTLVINGKKVNETTKADVVAGKIALQSEGGEIHFRTVKLIPLK